MTLFPGGGEKKKKEKKNTCLSLLQEIQKSQPIRLELASFESISQLEDCWRSIGMLSEADTISAVTECDEAGKCPHTLT